MTGKEVIETAKQLVKLTNKLIDYCNETGGCKNCVFSKYNDASYGCPINPQHKLVNIISRYMAKEEEE